MGNDGRHIADAVARLALKLEPCFQRGALDNMRAGKRRKGSVEVPNPVHLMCDTRAEDL
jgi:hypothetical protein